MLRENSSEVLDVASPVQFIWQICDPIVWEIRRGLSLNHKLTGCSLGASRLILGECDFMPRGISEQADQSRLKGAVVL